jgi:serine/threonine protein kinase
MDTGKWDKLTDLAAQALALDPAERAALLARECGADQSLRRAVEELVFANEKTSVMPERAGRADGRSEPTQPASTGTVPADTKTNDAAFIGTELDGRYLICAHIGSGGMGLVYRAQDKKLHNRDVVVKILRQEALETDYVRIKFKQEIEALARVKDASVVSIYDTGTLPDGSPYLVMEYVAGTSLEEVLPPEGLPLADVAEITKRIGHALSTVHELGIVHRDLKPSNIMIRRLARGLEVKVIDFGIARVKNSQIAKSTELGRGVGTILYMSPEQLLGRERPTEASDIYTLAVIAYEMATGRRPFNPTTAAQLSQLQEQGVRVMPQDLRPELPAAAQAVILKALAYQPALRYQNAAEFGDALAEALADEDDPLPVSEPRVPVAQDVAAKPDSNSVASITSPAPVQPIKQRRLNPALLILLAVLLCGGVGLLVWWASGRNAGNAGTAADPAAHKPPVVEREFSYSIIAQEKERGASFVTTDRQILRNHWLFRLRLSSPQSGYLYVLNEGLDKNNTRTIKIIYPMLDARNQSPIAANQQTLVGPFQLDEHPGTEQFWLVWAAQEVPELEAVREFINRTALGTISDEAKADAVRKFLAQSSTTALTEVEDRANSIVTVKGTGQVLAKLSHIEHK